MSSILPACSRALYARDGRPQCSPTAPSGARRRLAAMRVAYRGPQHRSQRGGRTAPRRAFGADTGPVFCVRAQPGRGVTNRRRFSSTVSLSDSKRPERTGKRAENPADGRNGTGTVRDARYGRPANFAPFLGTFRTPGVRCRRFTFHDRPEDTAGVISTIWAVHHPIPPRVRVLYALRTCTKKNNITLHGRPAVFCIFTFRPIRDYVLLFSLFIELFRLIFFFFYCISLYLFVNWRIQRTAATVLSVTATAAAASRRRLLLRLSNRRRRLTPQTAAKNRLGHGPHQRVPHLYAADRRRGKQRNQ